MFQSTTFIWQQPGKIAETTSPFIFRRGPRADVGPAARLERRDIWNLTSLYEAWAALFVGELMCGVVPSERPWSTLTYLNKCWTCGSDAHDVLLSITRSYAVQAVLVCGSSWWEELNNGSFPLSLISSRMQLGPCGPWCRCYAP